MRIHLHQYTLTEEAVHGMKKSHCMQRECWRVTCMGENNNVEYEMRLEAKEGKVDW